MLDTLSFRKLLTHREAGFSLLEIAIALTIMGVLLTALFPLYTRYHQARCWNQTEAHLSELSQALVSYFALHKQLPYAADESGNAQIGKTVGYIPYRRLGIPAKIARDGFGSPIRYSVHKDLISPDTYEEQVYLPRLQTDHFLNANPSFKVFDEYGRDVVGDSGSFVAFILIAGHSKDGREERQNWESSTEFYDLPFSMNEERLFRQKVCWISYTNLLGKTGMNLNKKEAGSADSLKKNSDDLNAIY